MRMIIIMIMIILKSLGQAIASDFPQNNGLCLIANAKENMPTLPLDNVNDQPGQMLMMMRGMTAKNFDPVRYSGRWFEVASLKRGFAGQGQEDCHCTQVNPLRWIQTSGILCLFY